MLDSVSVPQYCHSMWENLPQFWRGLLIKNIAIPHISVKSSGDSCFLQKAHHCTCSAGIFPPGGQWPWCNAPSTFTLIFTKPVLASISEEFQWQKETEARLWFCTSFFTAVYQSLSSSFGKFFLLQLITSAR